MVNSYRQSLITKLGWGMKKEREGMIRERLRVLLYEAVKP